MRTQFKRLSANLFVLLLITASSFCQQEMIEWEFKTADRVYATPVIQENILYIGSLDSNLYAIDAMTGIEKWRYESGNQIFGSVVVYDSIVGFESGNTLIGLSLDGKLKWVDTMYTGQVVNMNDAWDFFHSSPLLVDSIVYIGTEKGLVYGFNIINGQEVFSCQTDEQSSIETAPVVYNKILYFGDWTGILYAYNLETREQIWKYDTRSDNTYAWVNAITSSIKLRNDSLFFAGRSCNLYCMDANTGQRHWMFHDPGDMWLLGGPELQDSAIYIGSSYQHFIQSLNVREGKVNWNTKIEFLLYGKPLIDSNVVFMGTADESPQNGSLFTLDRYTGKMISKFDAKGQVLSSPIMNDDKIYFGCGNGYVYAIDKETLINYKYPISILQDKGPLKLGEHINTGIIDSLFYVKNIGENKDSVSVKTDRAGITCEPTEFIVAAADSQAIMVTIDLSQFQPKSHTAFITIITHSALINKPLSKKITFSISEPTSMKSNKKDYPVAEQNYPNPFEQTTKIGYNNSLCQDVTLKVFNVIGEEVATLVNERQSPGNFEVIFDSSGLPPGIYLYTLKAGNYLITRKMQKIRN